MARAVVQTVLSRWQDEGVGARVRRSVGTQQVNMMTSPFEKDNLVSFLQIKFFRLKNELPV